MKAKYHSLVGRRGKKKALIAVGHKMLIACYHILKHKTPYKELGPQYLDVRKQQRIVKGYLKRLQGLGYTVTLDKAA
jgi:transposase